MALAQGAASAQEPGPYTKAFNNIFNSIPGLQDTLDMTTTTRGPRAGSFQAQITELAVGESASKVRALDPTSTLNVLILGLPAMRQQLRNAIAPSVARAKSATGGTYAIEVGDMIMPAGSIYIVAVVTRTS